MNTNFLRFTAFCISISFTACQNIIFFDATNTPILHILNASFHFGNFVKHEFKYLAIAAYKVLPSKTPKLCQIHCVKEVKCVSINVAVSPDEGGKYLCELLGKDIFTATNQTLTNNTRFHHFAILNGCYLRSCENNGICSPVLKTMNFTCSCQRTFFGKHCEKACNSALGMEDGRILDSQISASSERRKDKPTFSYARLNKELGPYGAWEGREDIGIYLQIDLGTTKVVTMVATQGSAFYNHYVSSYALSYSENAQDWSKCRTSTYDEVFAGNVDGNTLVTHVLWTAYTARHMRFTVLKYSDETAMRVELYGCE